jgi:PmbA protein
MTAQDIARYALDKLGQSGAQAYSAAAHTVEKREFNVDGGLFSLLRTTFDKHLDLVAIRDHRRGKVLINDFSREAVDEAVNDCLASAEASAEDPAWQLAAGGKRRFEQGAPQGDMEGLFNQSKALLQTVKADYPKIMVEQMIVTHEKTEGLYLNSLGAEYETLEGEYGVSLMFSGHEGDKTGSFNGDGLRTGSLDKPFIEMGSLRQTLKDAEGSIDTTQPEGKFEGTVVFMPSCAQEVLSELLSNYAGDGVILEGTSQWLSKLGQQVVDPRITIRLAPHDKRIVCGQRYMQDGEMSRDYAVIKDGVLQQFMLSSYVANKADLKRAPNDAGNLIVTPGDQTLAQIIAGVEKGLLVGRFSGGQPSSSGDFSGVAKNSFLIENGRVKGAVSETMLSGNLAGMLNKLRAISRETVTDGSSVMPYIAVDGVTISGK